MDHKEKLEEIHRDVRATQETVTRLREEHLAHFTENRDANSSLIKILISMRNNMWHQFKTIHDYLLGLFRWDKKD